MTTGKKSLIPSTGWPFPETFCNSDGPFYFTFSPPFPNYSALFTLFLHIPPSLLYKRSWHFETLVCHFIGLPAFWIKAKYPLPPHSSLGFIGNSELLVTGIFLSCLSDFTLWINDFTLWFNDCHWLWNFTSDWDSNPHDQDLNLVKILLGLKLLGWDSDPAKTHDTWFQDLMKFRFLMSHHRKNSVRDKVTGKKWIYSDSERLTLHRQNVDHCRGWIQLRNAG